MRALLIAALLAAATPARAADMAVGPLPPDAALTLHIGPGDAFAALGRLAPGTGPLRAGPCVLLIADRDETDLARLPEWCLIAQDGAVLGWVAARHLIPADTALRVVRGWRGPDDTCRLLGETALTADFLDDSADLVGCPEGHPDLPTLRHTRAARELAQMLGLVLLSIPRR